jgi:hypothetical protein
LNSPGRQLRNKLSARGFRSRQKDHIGDLEADISKKTAVSKDLSAENDALTRENAKMRGFLAAFNALPADLAPTNGAPAGGDAGLGLLGVFPPAAQTRAALEREVAAAHARGEPGGMPEQMLNYAALIAASRRKNEGA